MAEDVFISYCHENKAAAKVLADTVAANGYSVWWDHELVAGDSYTEVIEQKLDVAKAIIVIWSENSRKSYWVRDEAAVGRDRNRLLPVGIDSNPPPLGFRQVQTVDLQGWDGKDVERIAPLLRGLDALVRKGRTFPQLEDASVSNAFGGAQPKVEEKRGEVVPGYNAKPNNKPLKQILREEKKQRTFFRTYFWTSFVLSGVLAAICAVLMPMVVPELKEAAANSGDKMMTFVGYAIAMFIFVGIGLFLGRAFIIIGRRLSKRKSIRYFDSTTLICAGLTLICTVGFAYYAVSAPEASGMQDYTAGQNIVYSGIAGVAVLFPMFAFFSIPIGFFRGLGRTTYADGQ